ncbi:MAG: glycosyltransferase family 2 protein [Pirellulales bacterium]|nr:glycosyltransferase family 2 protein [Pirellulales bacterium]
MNRIAPTPPEVLAARSGPHFAMASTATSPHAVRTTVALIVVHYNSGPHLLRCLAAVAGQTRRPDRVLLFDNGSGDGASREAQARWPWVEVIRSDHNLGFAVANNRALALCPDADWIALLNADAFPEPDWLEQLLAAAAVSGERCAALASLMLRDDRPERLDGAGDAYHASGFAFRLRCGEDRAQTSLAAGEVFAACAAAALYRRAALDEVGAFDEDYFCYFEDVDLGLRLRLAGYHARLVPCAVVRHVGSASRGRTSNFTVYHAHRNLVWTWWKCLPVALLLGYLPQHLLLQLVSIGWFAARGQGRTILRAKWHALRGLPRVWRQRRSIQARRRASHGELHRAILHGVLAPYRRRRD